jgi:hypothetical protein
MAGIDYARKMKADVITYLDTDDYLLPTHLSDISKAFEAHPEADWIWYNNILKQGYQVRETALQVNHIGTSDISHRANLAVNWPDGYRHDWGFIQSLPTYKGLKVPVCGYVVCHIPNQFDL